MMTKKTCLYLASFTVTIGLVSVLAQDSKDPKDASKTKDADRKTAQPPVFKKKAKPTTSAKIPGRGGHYLPPRERRLDELITKIRAAEQNGQTYKGPHRMTGAEREKALSNRRVKKIEGGPDFRDGISGAESEYAIAVDPTGQNIVVGYNLFADDPNGVAVWGSRIRMMVDRPLWMADSCPRPATRSPPAENCCPTS